MQLSGRDFFVSKNSPNRTTTTGGKQVVLPKFPLFPTMPVNVLSNPYYIFTPFWSCFAGGGGFQKPGLFFLGVPLRTRFSAARRTLEPSTCPAAAAGTEDFGGIDTEESGGIDICAFLSTAAQHMFLKICVQ